MKPVSDRISFDFRIHSPFLSQGAPVALFAHASVNCNRQSDQSTLRIGHKRLRARLIMSQRGSFEQLGFAKAANGFANCWDRG
jgi:hypothetical protein